MSKTLLAAVGVLGFGALLWLHRRKLKKQTEKKQDKAKEENETAAKETRPAEEKYTPLELSEEIWSAWNESRMPLKIEIVDIKVIFYQVLARSINKTISNSLLKASPIPLFGMRLFNNGCYPDPKYKFFGAIGQTK